MMSIKSESSSLNDRNNLEWGYLAMQQQLKMMNTRFGNVMNDMSGLKTKLASFWDELICRALEGKRLIRRVISPSNEFIAKKKNKKKRR